MTSQAESRLSVLDGALDRVRDGDAFSGELFAVVDALLSSPILRRAVTDPGTPEEARQALVRGLFGGKVSEQVVDLVAEGAALRWSGGRTFAAALERQAVRAQLLAAEQAGQLDETEDELFRFARLVESNPDLRNALSDRAIGLAPRQELVEGLLSGKVTAATVALAKRAVLARERTFGHTIESYVTLAAQQKNRLVATVRVAQPMTAEQRDRLRRSLSKQVGRDVALQEVIDDSVIGGVLVELADEVVEGTVAARLHEAEQLFNR
jgi:F-type H+-transporting ATPase subunit delta